MAPKRRVKVVRAIKKVVEQTVEVLTVGSDSHSTVEVAYGSESNYVEVVVEAKEDGVPVEVVITSATSTDKQLCKRKELEREKRGGEEEERGGEQQSHPSEEKKAVQKRQDGEKASDSIADKETQEEEKEGGLEDEGKAAEPRTPKKAELPPQMDQARRKKRGRRKRHSGPGGGAREMDGVGRGYKKYVFRVLKQVHPEMGISARAMAVMDGLMGDMFERLADEAARLAAHARKATLSSRGMQAAVRLVLPGELGKHAISEGNKAVSNRDRRTPPSLRREVASAGGRGTYVCVFCRAGLGPFCLTGGPHLCIF